MAMSQERPSSAPAENQRPPKIGTGEGAPSVCTPWGLNQGLCPALLSSLPLESETKK